MSRLEIRLPDLGEGLTEATVVQWLVTVGETVTLDQPLAVVETDKATVEFPSPAAGRVAALAVPDGTTVEVGALLAELEVDEPAGREPAPTVAPAAPGPPAPASSGPVLVGSGPPPPNAPVRRRRPVAAPVPVPVAPAPAGRADGYRRVMAERMATAHREIPPASCTREIDARPLLDAVAAHRAADPVTALTPFAALTRVVAVSLVDHPRLRTRYGAEPTTTVELAIAVDTPHGLVAPVLHDAAALSPVALVAALTQLTDAATARRLTPAQVTGATVAITNHGRFGTDDGVPIVPPGQAAALAVGAIRPRPFVIGDAVVARPTVFLTLVFDHRHIDGADAARFLGDLAARLTEPTGLAALLA